MDWKRLLSELYDSETTRLRFLPPLSEARLREMEPITGPVAATLGGLLLQTNGVLKQWRPSGKSAPDVWEDSEWLVWDWDRMKKETRSNRDSIIGDDGFDPGTLMFFSNAGLSSVAYGCNDHGEIWLWGRISGEFERRFTDLETFFRRDAADQLYS